MLDHHIACRVEAHTKVLKADLDEADRRAGAAERLLEFEVDSRIKRDVWLRKAKAEAGYDNNVSFDVVWQDVLKKSKGVPE